jgi:hypothetical protein
MNEKQTSTLQILKKLSQQEQHKASAIAEVTQMVEQGLMIIEPTEKAVREALNKQYKEVVKRQQTETETSAATPKDDRLKSKILDLLKGGCEKKIAKAEKKIAEVEKKISAKQSDIGVSKKQIAILQSKIEKAEQKISGFRSSSEILGEARTKGNSFFIGLLVKKNDREIEKLQKKIEHLRSDILSEGTLIKSREAKIAEQVETIAGHKTAIEVQTEKISRMKIIDKAEIPHATMTYFLTERLSMTADELNAVFERPTEYVSAAVRNSEMAEVMTAAAEVPPQETEFTETLNADEQKYYNGYRENFADEAGYGEPPPEGYEKIQEAVHEEFYQAGMENAGIDPNSNLAYQMQNRSSFNSAQKIAVPEDYEEFLEEKRAANPEKTVREQPQTGTIPRDMPTEIITLQWHKKEKIAYLGVNKAAFPNGADLSEHEKLCEDFGTRKCENFADFKKIDTRADKEVRAKIGELEVKPSIAFLATYINGDTKTQFVQDSQNDFPVVFNRSETYKLSWAEPAYNAENYGKNFSESLGRAEGRCAAVSVRACKNEKEYYNQLSEFGDSAKTAYSENSAEEVIVQAQVEVGMER